MVVVAGDLRPAAAPLSDGEGRVVARAGVDEADCQRAGVLRRDGVDGLWARTVDAAVDLVAAGVVRARRRAAAHGVGEVVDDGAGHADGAGVAGVGAAVAAAEAAGVAAPGWARLMDWTEVNRLSELGHEIGSHGCSHALLPQLDREGQRAELKGSMDAVEQFTARKPVSICYPNGSFNEMTLTLAEEVGYENAVTTLWGINDRAACPFRLLRCDMDAGRLVDRKGALSSARLAMRVSGKQPGLVGH